MDGHGTQATILSLLQVVGEDEKTEAPFTFYRAITLFWYVFGIFANRVHDQFIFEVLSFVLRCQNVNTGRGQGPFKH